MRTRFAPSPTGPLHLGHAYSATLAHDMARDAGGDMLLRIEDIDQTRARPEYEAQIYDDLTWLGLTWPTPVLRQSERHPAYNAALRHLWARGLIYPCHCRRRDIAAAASAPQEGTAPLIGPDGLIYPGTCRPSHAGQITPDQPDPGAAHPVLPHPGSAHTGQPDPSLSHPGQPDPDQAHSAHPQPVPPFPGPAHTATPHPDARKPFGPLPEGALRLDMARALGVIAAQPMRPPLGFTEQGAGPDGETGLIPFDPGWLITHVGDVVLARRDMVGSYHLSVVLDDAAQGITHVIRGQDLFSATAIHVVLQRLFQLPTPIYHHHALVRDETGKRLAKRDDARALATYRAEGKRPDEIRALAMAGLIQP